MILNCFLFKLVATKFWFKCHNNNLNVFKIARTEIQEIVFRLA